MKSDRFLLILTAAVLLLIQQVAAEPVHVRYAEGLVHGFLTLSDVNDHILATGELLQSAEGSRVTSELIFHFKDGSLHDETAVYSQRRTLQLLTYHLVQKGPAFKHPIDLSFNTRSGETTVKELGDGKEKTISDNRKLPNDLANGILITLVLDIDPSTPRTTVSMCIGSA